MAVSNASRGMCVAAVWSKRIEARAGNSSSPAHTTMVIGKRGKIMISTEASPYSRLTAFKGSPAIRSFSGALPKMSWSFSVGRSCGPRKKNCPTSVCQPRILKQYTNFHSPKDHLCSAHQHYIDRSPEYYIQKAKGKSKELHELIELLFKQNRLPEQLYKSCDGLFSLHRKTNSQTYK